MILVISIIMLHYYQFINIVIIMIFTVGGIIIESHYRHRKIST